MGPVEHTHNHDMELADMQAQAARMAEQARLARRKDAMLAAAPPQLARPPSPPLPLAGPGSDVMQVVPGLHGPPGRSASGPLRPPLPSGDPGDAGRHAEPAHGMWHGDQRPLAHYRCVASSPVHAPTYCV